MESLRAVSALGVLTAHILSLGLVYQGLTATYPRRLLLGGGQGLQLFFAMSGFLLFLPFLRRQTGVGRPIDLRTPGWADRPLVGASSAWIAAGVALQLLICWDLDLREPFVALATFLAVAGCVLPLRAGVAADATGAPPSFATLLGVGVPVCLAVAFISYAIVERPFLRLRRRWGATA